MDEKSEAWLRSQLETAARVLTETGTFEDGLVEVKPIWALPLRLLVGKARKPADPVGFSWFISGEVPFDHIAGETAQQPREVLRHFSMKWQLDAEKLSGDEAEKRIELAHDVYDLAQDERFWTHAEGDT